jgi:hypothetical protein
MGSTVMKKKKAKTHNAHTCSQPFNVAGIRRKRLCSNLVACTFIQKLEQPTSITEGTDNTRSASAARVAAIIFGVLKISKRPVGLSKAMEAPHAIWNEVAQNQNEEQ